MMKIMKKDGTEKRIFMDESMQLKSLLKDPHEEKIMKKDGAKKGTFIGEVVQLRPLSKDPHEEKIMKMNGTEKGIFIDEGVQLNSLLNDPHEEKTRKKDGTEKGIFIDEGVQLKSLLKVPHEKKIRKEDCTDDSFTGLFVQEVKIAEAFNQDGVTDIVGVCKDHDYEGVKLETSAASYEVEVMIYYVMPELAQYRWVLDSRSFLCTSCGEKSYGTGIFPGAGHHWCHECHDGVWPDDSFLDSLEGYDSDDRDDEGSYGPACWE